MTFIQLLYRTILKMVILIFNYYFPNVEEPVFNRLLHYSPCWLVIFITDYYIPGHSKIGANERRGMTSHTTFHITESFLQYTWESCFITNITDENVWLYLGQEGKGEKIGKGNSFVLIAYIC